MILDTDDHATYMVAADDQYQILHKSESILLPYQKDVSPYKASENVCLLPLLKWKLILMMTLYMT